MKPKASIPLVVLLLAIEANGSQNAFETRSTRLRAGYSGQLDLASQVGAASSAARLNGVRPNLVVIMADDLDVHSLDVLIARGLMPNLKRHIIDRGVTFNQSFVTNSLCCPSRATFLTGQYSHNNSVLTNTPGTSGSVTALRDNLTLATWLQGAGYRTGHVGKYLNMYGTGRPPYDHPALDPTYVPPGWDDWQGLVDSTTYQVYDYTINDNGNLMTYGSQEEHPEHYQTDVLADRAVSFIQESNSLGDAQPFFLMVAPLAPHVEVDLGEPESIARWGKTIRPDPQDQFDKPLAWSTLQNLQLLPAQKASFNELDVSDKPRWLRQRNMLDATDITKLTRQYRDRLTTLLSIDDLIGKVVTTLESAGELDNTLIVFTSDNGWLYGEHRLSSKMVAYEESIRVPTYVRTPWVPGRTSVDEAALNNDWAPTFLELAEANSGSLVVDGRSLVPLLQGTTPAVWRKRFLVEHWPNVALFDIPKFSTIRTLASDTTDPLMLYVEYRSNGGLILGKELYDLKVDPLELLSVDSVFKLRFQRQRLSAHVSALVTCSGLRCQNFEN